MPGHPRSRARSTRVSVVLTGARRRLERAAQDALARADAAAAAQAAAESSASDARQQAEQAAAQAKLAETEREQAIAVGGRTAHRPPRLGGGHGHPLARVLQLQVGRQITSKHLAAA